MNKKQTVISSTMVVRVSESTVWRTLRQQHYRGHTTRSDPLIRNQKDRLELTKKYRDDPQKLWNQNRHRTTLSEEWRGRVCGWGTDQSGIHNIQAHLWSMAVVVSWPGVARQVLLLFIDDGVKGFKLVNHQTLTWLSSISPPKEGGRNPLCGCKSGKHHRREILI